ncbi:MAG: ankyrin repeat domain-containing protein [Methylocella sp.]
MPFISEEEFLNRFLDARDREDPELKRAWKNLLLDAAYKGRTDFVRKLLERRSDIDAADEETGMTALHIAVGRDHLELTRFLVERGASFVPDKQGRMPTTVAAECEVSEELCDFIADAEARAEGV